MRSEVDQEKTSLFLSRKVNNYACSSILVTMPRQMALSGTVGSKAIFLNLPSASMAFLNSTRASALMGNADC
jgi:hypothetical protein